MPKTEGIGQALELLLSRIITAALYIGMAAVVLLMLVTVVHSLGRYAFARPVPGIIELSGYLLVSAVFLIAPYAMLTKQHITIGLLVDSRSVRTQSVIDSITYFICIVFTAAAAWQTCFQANYIMKTGQTSAILHIPNHPFYYLVGVGWALFSLAILKHLVRSVRRALNP